MKNRKYLPTLGELLDRLTILQIKEIKQPAHKAEYAAEIKDVVHDIGLLLPEAGLSSDNIRDLIILTLNNAWIYQNESNARKGIGEGNDLELTHGLNSIRCAARNKIQASVKGRKDYKQDYLTAPNEWIPSGYEQ